MTSLPDRPHTALVVVDVQNDVVANAYRRDEVIANINALIDTARAQEVPVIWVQHGDDDLPRGTDGWQYVPELLRRESEPLVHKQYGDSFEDTTLESELALHGAFVRGYDTILVGDAHTTEDFSEYGLPPADMVIAHTNMYWKNEAAPGRIAAVVSAADVSFVGAGDGATSEGSL